MAFAFEASDGRTVFIIASDFKNIALFKPKSWRGTKDDRDVDVVWYSDTKKIGLLRVSGNVHQYRATITKNNKFDYQVLSNR